MTIRGLRNLILAFGALLITAGTLTVIGLSQSPYHGELTELERTRLELALEKQKTNAAQAALIRNAYEANQAQGQKLQDDAKALSDSICTAHGLAPADCEYSKDGLTVHAKAQK